MRTCHRVPRVAILGLLVGISLLAVPGRVSAMPGFRADRHFNGQVISVAGSPDNPTGFTLQTPLRAVDFVIGPHAVFQAGSAEAEVEGFQSGDFAIVQAHHKDGAWVASLIEFDIQPLGPEPVTISGTIAKLAPNGRHFALKLDAGGVRWIWIVKRTRFEVAGQQVNPAPSLQPGQAVDVEVVGSQRGLVALQINVKSTAGAVPPH